MDQRENPVGFFDSGLGGLSVLKLARSMLGHEDFIYYGDNANAPYGTKPKEQIIELSCACMDFLLQRKVKAVVVACNTATSAAVEFLREKYPLPVLSMEPAVKPALSVNNGGKVLVMATPATVSQPRYQSLVKNLHAADIVLDLPCEGLVELIENGQWTGSRIDSYLSSLFLHIRREHIGSVVLGCTHYALAKEAIQKNLKAIGISAPILDGAAGTARHLCNVLEKNGLLNHRKADGEFYLYTSGDASKLMPFYNKIMES